MLLTVYLREHHFCGLLGLLLQSSHTHSLFACFYDLLSLVSWCLVDYGKGEKDEYVNKVSVDHPLSCNSGVEET